MQNTKNITASTIILLLILVLLILVLIKMALLAIAIEVFNAGIILQYIVYYQYYKSLIILLNKNVEISHITKMLI